MIRKLLVYDSYTLFWQKLRFEIFGRVRGGTPRSIFSDSGIFLISGNDGAHFASGQERLNSNSLRCFRPPDRHHHHQKSIWTQKCSTNVVLQELGDAGWPSVENFWTRCLVTVFNCGVLGRETHAVRVCGCRGIKRKVGAGEIGI